MTLRLPALIRLKDYLERGRFEQDLFLNQARTVSFHWADSDATCWWLSQEKNLSMQDPRLKELLYQMEELKREEVWVRDRNQLRAISLYDFFCAQVDPNYIGVDFKKPEVLVSTLGPQGEFYNVGINGIPEASRFEDFIHHKVLEGSVPWRKFRLRVDIPLLCFIQGQFEDCALILVKQISNKGMLIFVPSAQVFQRLLAADFLHALIDTEGIRRVLVGEADSVHAANQGALLMPENAEQLFRIELKRNNLGPPHQWMMEKLWGRGQRFLFIPFQDILRESNHECIGNTLTPVCEEIESEVQLLTQKKAS